MWPGPHLGPLGATSPGDALGAVLNHLRTVTVHKVSGKELYSDTTVSDRGWATGNAGQVRGKFYAAVNAKGGCLPLVSKAIQA